ncbi:MAG TPA: DMT family transporter [Bryobacteraceae bacterium]|nr:DMT family transporter [Bryobacteraceae bacterium]
MPLQAFILVAIAAFAHATWNLIAKRAAHSKHVIWFSSMAETLLFLPVAVWIVRASYASLGWKAAVFLAATGILHIFYFDALQKGYRAADLSVVYPLARGTGPLLTFFGAIVTLGERPSLLSSGGALMVTGGVLLISGFRGTTRGAGIFWGLATGVMIACYTLTDGYSVKVLLVSPFLVEYAGCVFRLFGLSSRGWNDRRDLARELRLYWKHALSIAILLPAGYILVLFAMRIAPVSHVAPIREMSMLLAAFFGTRFLEEGNTASRIGGAGLIAAGVAALAAG